MFYLLIVLLIHIIPSYSRTEISDLNPAEVALLQFDSRPLGNYWLAAALWNQAYTQLHGHKFIYYDLDVTKGCRYGQTLLADAWCKVRAMNQANDDYPEVKLFIYMDSDAVVDKAYFNISLINVVSNMQVKLKWDPLMKPMVFNQDGPCWWCSMVQEKGYTMCLNAGTVMWYRHDRSEAILKNWWDSSMDSYASNPLKRQFRLNWPWEQDRQMFIYNQSSEFIQITSHPNKPFMPWDISSRNKRVKKIENWCFSHLPGCGCFISHHCANAKSKQIMRRTYSVPFDQRLLNAVKLLRFPS